MNKIELFMPVLLTLLQFFLFVWLPFVFIRELLTQFKQPTSKEKIVEKCPSPEAIIVRSKTVIGQLATVVDKDTPKEKRIENENTFDHGEHKKGSAAIPDDELDEAFLHNEKMNIDIEIETGEDDGLTLEEEMEDDELLALTGDMDAGVSLDEMNQTVETISNPSPTQREQEQAVDVMNKVRTTDMMQQVVKSIPGCESRIEQLLNECEQKYEKSLPSKRAVTKKPLPNDFKLDDYIS